MSGFDPGPGWREVTDLSEVDGITCVEFHDADEDHSRYWVREVPVPALPTAPYTVIRVTWRGRQAAGGNPVLVLHNAWYRAGSDGQGYSDDELTQRITSFEVLSEPRAVTAKAVLRDVLGFYNSSEAAGMSLRDVVRAVEKSWESR